jgi:hypothetical protein
MFSEARFFDLLCLHLLKQAGQQLIPIWKRGQPPKDTKKKSSELVSWMKGYFPIKQFGANYWTPTTWTQMMIDWIHGLQTQPGFNATELMIAKYPLTFDMFIANNCKRLWTF